MRRIPEKSLRPFQTTWKDSRLRPDYAVQCAHCDEWVVNRHDVVGQRFACTGCGKEIVDPVRDFNEDFAQRMRERQEAIRARDALLREVIAPRVNVNPAAQFTQEFRVAMREDFRDEE